MAGPITVSAAAAAALRVRPYASSIGALAQGASALVGEPRLIIVGMGRTAPKTTQSLVEQAVRAGLEPGRDVIVTRYADLAVGRRGGFVRLARGTGDDGLVLAGQGQRSLFLFRGGGNLGERELAKIAKVQAVDGATALSDLGFIRRAGSKAATFEVLRDAGVALPATIPVRGSEDALRAFDEVMARPGSQGIAVLKKVNSLGGKDVHFVTSRDDVVRVIAAEPDAGYVMQEYLPAARDQDVRVHLVFSHATSDFEVANSYVRNRVAGARTPNLASGGFPIGYVLSPWEEQQALAAARALAQGSPHAPLHVGLDLFPRQPITATSIERNLQLRELVATAAIDLDTAVARSVDSMVIGEAASSAGTKGTEIVLGEGTNPVTERMMQEIVHIRRHGVSRLAIDDAVRAARGIRG